MSLRLEMLQVARLAPRQLGESGELVTGFLRSRLNPDGGFQDRTGASDLYYTVFGLDGLIAMQAAVPGATAAYLDRFEDVDGPDFVHACCLARGYAALHRRPDAARIDRILARVESYRSSDGGYAATPRASFGTAYGAFLAIGAYQDLGRPFPDAGRVLDSLAGLRAADGGYANHPDAHAGITPATAAAVMVMRQCDRQPPPDVGMWLLDRCHARGGFFAAAATPIPDLLSTATALHALSALHVPLAGVAEPCLDFVDSLWTNRGGFFGTWADDAADCEYTYYALLALGHLSLTTSDDRE